MPDMSSLLCQVLAPDVEMSGSNLKGDPPPKSVVYHSSCQNDTQ